MISTDNQHYTKIKITRDNWVYQKDYKGDITLIITNPVTARYIKVHCKYDDWDVSLDQDNQIISLKKGEFTNLLGV